MKSRRIRWAKNVACICEMRSEYKILIGRAEGKKETIWER
jgi:hypothetical protein